MMGTPKTLGDYRDLCAALAGEDSRAVKFFDDKIKQSIENGRDEKVIADESQMMFLVAELIKNDFQQER